MFLLTQNELYAFEEAIFKIIKELYKSELVVDLDEEDIYDFNIEDIYAVSFTDSGLNSYIVIYDSGIKWINERIKSCIVKSVMMFDYRYTIVVEYKGIDYAFSFDEIRNGIKVDRKEICMLTY